MSLSKLYDDIVAKATVNRSSQEIKDISSAMEEMLGRLVSGGMEVIYHKNSFTTTLKFGPSYLQPCGSMAEGTALWKSVKRQGRERKFIEFDYLVILGNQDKVVVIKEGNCQGCMGFNNRNDELLRPRAFCRSFLSALYCKINNMCSCLVDSNDTGTEVDSRPCDSCTVVRSTGYLQFAKIPDISAENVAENVKENEHCSLVLYWTSSTDSFLAPNVETLQSTEKIKRLVIRVDIVPAFEFPDNRDGDKRFIISKLCPHCDCLDCFMVSYCMHEMTAIRHVSEIHKQSYIIIKFLLGQLIYWTGDDEFTNSYYAKVAFLTHCQTCTDEHGDCTKCITEILQSLVDTSGSLKLLKFHQVASLRIREYDVDVTLFQLPLLSLLHVISQLKRHSEKSNSQYRPCHVVGLIKQTCRLLFEGDPGIHEVNGRPFENTVPALDILGVLMKDEDLCYRFLHDTYEMKELCPPLSCTEPEKGILGWRAWCLVKMIMASDIADIRDDTIKKAVEDVQDYVKEQVERYCYKQLTFLTSSQSVQEMSNNDLENSSQTPSPDECCTDTSDRSVPTDSILTDDLQLNWSAVTAKRMKQTHSKFV